MAKEKVASGFDPEAQYRVTLNRVVRHGSMILRPRDEDILLKGRLVEALGDAIETFEKVEPAGE